MVTFVRLTIISLALIETGLSFPSMAKVIFYYISLLIRFDVRLYNVNLLFYFLRGMKSTQEKREIRGIEEQGIFNYQKDYWMQCFLFSLLFIDTEY